MNKEIRELCIQEVILPSFESYREMTCGKLTRNGKNFIKLADTDLSGGEFSIFISKTWDSGYFVKEENMTSVNGIAFFFYKVLRENVMKKGVREDDERYLDEIKKEMHRHIEQLVLGQYE